MRVAHVNQDEGVAPGKKKGAAVHVDAMRRAFEKVGADVLALDVFDDVALVSELSRAHEHAGIDLFYERYALNRYAVSRFAHAHAIPHVLEVNAPLAEEEARWRDGSRSAVDGAVERELFSRAARVLAVSSTVARYCVERGARAERVVVTPNAVDPDLFRPRAQTDALRSELVPAGRLVLGFHGRLRPWHNFSFLVSALMGLIARGVPAHLLVLGEGEFESQLAGRVDPSKYTIIGWRPQVEAARIVACTDVLPLTYAAGSPCYFSPLKLLEAMSTGAVPIVPRLGDLTQAVQHEHNGLVYEADDLDGLVSAIERVHSDTKLCARLSRAARAYAEERSWTRIARDLLEIVPTERRA